MKTCWVSESCGVLQASCIFFLVHLSLYDRICARTDFLPLRHKRSRPRVPFTSSGAGTGGENQRRVACTRRLPSLVAVDSSSFSRARVASFFFFAGEQKKKTPQSCAVKVCATFVNMGTMGSALASAGHVSQVCLKSCLIYPVAWACHIYAVLTLPINVTLATLRTLAGTKERGVDELLASFFLPGGVVAAENDKLLLQSLREKHGAAVGALRDQLEDSESRYKVSGEAHTGTRRATPGTNVQHSLHRVFFSWCKYALHFKRARSWQRHNTTTRAKMQRARIIVQSFDTVDERM